MATRYIHEFSSLANFNQASRDKPNAFAIGAVGGALYPGQDSSGANVHFHINTQGDNKAVRINVRDFTQASGDSIGLRAAPNQTVTTTGSIVGGEFSPRITDADGGHVIALKASPVIKDATAARTVANVRAIEMNIDLPNAGSAITFTDGPTAIRIFPDFGNGHTFSGRRVILLLAAPNTSDWQYLLEAETGTNGWITTTAGTYSTADGYIVIRVGASDYRIPFFAGTD